VHCQPAVFVASLAAVEKLHHLQPAVSRGASAGPRLLGLRVPQSGSYWSPIWSSLIVF
jgi:hypothetical protein